jgi:hypothetical protein
MTTKLMGVLVAMLFLGHSTSLAQTSEANCDISKMTEKVQACVSSEGLSQESCASMVSAQCISAYGEVPKTKLTITSYYVTEYNCYEKMVKKVGVVFAEDTLGERSEKCLQIAKDLSSVSDDTILMTTSVDDTCITTAGFSSHRIVLDQCMNLGRK